MEIASKKMSVEKHKICRTKEKPVELKKDAWNGAWKKTWLLQISRSRAEGPSFIELWIILQVAVLEPWLHFAIDSAALEYCHKAKCSKQNIWHCEPI